MNNNNKTIMNPQNSTAISTDDTRPIVVPKINLTNTGGNAPAPKNLTAVPTPPKASKLGMAYSITGFALGIISLVAVVILGLFSIPLSFVGFIAMLPYGIGIVTAIVGIVFSTMGRNRSDNTGLAKAGLIMNIIPLAILAGLVTISILGCAALASCLGMMVSSAGAALFVL